MTESFLNGIYILKKNMPFKCQECYGNLYIFEDISSTEFQLFKSHSPLHILVIFYNFQIFIYYCCRGLSSVRYACNGKLHILYLIMHCSSHKHFHHSWLEFWNGKIMFLFSSGGQPGMLNLQQWGRSEARSNGSISNGEPLPSGTKLC